MKTSHLLFTVLVVMVGVCRGANLECKLAQQMTPTRGFRELCPEIQIQFVDHAPLRDVAAEPCSWGCEGLPVYSKKITELAVYPKQGPDSQYFQLEIDFEHADASDYCKNQRLEAVLLDYASPPRYLTLPEMCGSCMIRFQWFGPATLGGQKISYDDPIRREMQASNNPCVPVSCSWLPDSSVKVHARLDTAIGGKSPAVDDNL